MPASATRQNFTATTDIVLLAALAVIAAVVVLALAKLTMGFLVDWALRILAVAIDSAGSLSLLILLASWLIVLPSTSAGVRSEGYTIAVYAYNVNLSGQLPGWDWERLRLGATIWVVVEFLGLWTTRGNPIPFVTGVVTAATLGLALLQYTALGGGQPVWGMEHLVKHLMLDVAGF